MDWCRLWHDMPTDPKWRVVARKSGRPLTEVLSVFTIMMVNASKSKERGTLDNWDDEDTGAALDMDAESVSAIREAMQGKVLDGGALAGWKKRQPKREDNSSTRVSEHRKRLEQQRNADVTQANAPEERRLDSSLTNVREDTAKAAPTHENQLAAKRKLWDWGTRYLVQTEGISDKAARSFIGGCLRKTEEDFIAVLETFEIAESKETADARGYISAFLKVRETKEKPEYVPPKPGEMRGGDEIFLTPDAYPEQWEAWKAHFIRARELKFMPRGGAWFSDMWPPSSPPQTLEQQDRKVG